MRYGSVRSVGAGITLASAFLLPPARAQQAPEQQTPQQQLTGGTSREWVFRRIIRSMGSGDACTSGLTYTFEAAARALVVRECKGGKLDASLYTWQLASASAGDTALVVDRLGRFVLLFRDAPEGHFMRLRKPGASPTQATEDREFRLNED